MISNDFLLRSCTHAERSIIIEVAARAVRELFGPAGIRRKGMDVAMDLEAAHALCPLDFERMRDASPRTFAADVQGIYANLDREQGVLRNGFVPSCAMRHGEKFYTSRADDPKVGRVYVVDGERVRILNPRTDLINHSPTGFAWGYHGSGPAQLALAILSDASGHPKVALDFYQAFKAERIATIDEDVWRIYAKDVIDWLDVQRVPA